MTLLIKHVNPTVTGTYSVAFKIKWNGVFVRGNHRLNAWLVMIFNLVRRRIYLSFNVILFCLMGHDIEFELPNISVFNWQTFFVLILLESFSVVFLFFIFNYRFLIYLFVLIYRFVSRFIGLTYNLRTALLQLNGYK